MVPVRMCSAPRGPGIRRTLFHLEKTMERIALKTNCALAFVIAGILAAGQAVADKPSWAGSGKGEKSEHREKSEKKQSRQRDGDERSRRDRAGSTAKMR